MQNNIQTLLVCLITVYQAVPAIHMSLEFLSGVENSLSNLFDKEELNGKNPNKMLQRTVACCYLDSNKPIVSYSMRAGQIDLTSLK